MSRGVPVIVWLSSLKVNPLGKSPITDQFTTSPPELLIEMVSISSPLINRNSERDDIVLNSGGVVSTVKLNSTELTPPEFMAEIVYIPDDTVTGEPKMTW